MALFLRNAAVSVREYVRNAVEPRLPLLRKTIALLAPETAVISSLPAMRAPTSKRQRTEGRACSDCPDEAQPRLSEVGFTRGRFGGRDRLDAARLGDEAVEVTDRLLRVRSVLLQRGRALHQEGHVDALHVGIGKGDPGVPTGARASVTMKLLMPSPMTGLPNRFSTATST